MIPGPFICTNNKTYKGYKYIFEDLLVKMKGYTNLYAKRDLKIKTFTIDYESVLCNAFNDVFSKEIKDLHYIGCYYHFISNIIKKLNSLGLRKYLKNKLNNNDTSEKNKDRKNFKN